MNESFDSWLDLRFDVMRFDKIGLWPNLHTHDGTYIANSFDYSDIDEG